MILKLDKNKLIISNFLGEKVSRHATILPNVDVQIKGAKITITSNDKEAAGQTAANIEKASIVRNRDRRVFQDGIYIIEKPGRAE
jgi:large subunit ribosomal protein L6